MQIRILALHTLFFPFLLEREVSKALTLQGQAFLLATATYVLPAITQHINSIIEIMFCQLHK